MRFNISSVLVILIFFLISCYTSDENLSAFDKTEKYYGKKIEKYASEYKISVNYLKALVVLECSGKKNIPNRFEQGVYDKLVSVKNKESDSFENITYELLKDTPDSTLRDMASSWGPLQIMGYKCITLGVDVSVLKGKSNLAYSIKWINDTYGKYIKQGKYKDAFHIHNAGKPYPADGTVFTTDPSYVSNGIKYMKYFIQKNSPKNKTKLKVGKVFNKKKKPKKSTSF